MGQEALRLAAALAATLICALPAAAQEEAETICGTDRTTLAAEGAPSEMLFGRDDRELLDSSRFPWRAIGQLVTPHNTCTGTVVADSLVLTAAHCVSEFIAGRMAPAEVQFYAGLQGGYYQEAATATRIVPAPDYTDRARPDGDVSDDWALVVLDRPIGTATGTLPVYDLRAGDLYYLAQNSWGRIDQAGYSSDRPEGLTGHLGCRIGNARDAGWVQHDCDTVPGDSGSPLLVERDRTTYVVAVVSGVRCRRNGSSVYNTAADARAFYVTFAALAASRPVGTAVEVPGRMTAPPSSGPRIVRICENGPC